ncbi:hypothetical protein HOY82DRAFT_620004 [Tuber indicum]|nr:hypothetical protein HOY82DRAFT_620004 [Tuber indicum]
MTRMPQSDILLLISWACVSTHYQQQEPENRDYLLFFLPVMRTFRRPQQASRTASPQGLVPHPPSALAANFLVSGSLEGLTISWHPCTRADDGVFKFYGFWPLFVIVTLEAQSL